MKITILYLLFSFLFVSVNAQKMSLDIIGTPPDFNYNTISDYETPKIANNAIRIDVDTKKTGYQIYIRSDGPIKTSSGQSIPESKFGIRIHNTIQVVPLSSTNDALLISLDNNDKDVESYYLDFIVSPLYYDYDPGSYIVNILFTLTKN
ncbi:MAG: hypothetical protein Q8S54_07115 [Bacteroidota bacterium]|nr:hypothetical protein [Bacteroidota bacterium]